MKCVAQLLECDAGWIAEINIFADLNVSTRVYPDKEQCKTKTEKMAAKLSLELNWKE